MRSHSIVSKEETPSDTLFMIYLWSSIQLHLQIDVLVFHVNRGMCCIVGHGAGISPPIEESSYEAIDGSIIILDNHYCVLNSIRNFVPSLLSRVIFPLTQV